MLPYRDSRITKYVIIAFFILVAAYAVYEGRGIVQGPAIEIEGRVLEVSEPTIAIQGKTERIASLSMNGKVIPVTEEGGFSELYVLTPGYNRITLSAQDRYGKTTDRIIEVVYTPKEMPSPAE